MSASRRKPSWRQFTIRGLLMAMVGAAVLLWLIRPETFDARYFPIGVGYKWVYASDQGDVVFEVVGRKKFGTANCYVVDRSIGEHHEKFYVAVERKGVSIHQVGDDLYDPPYRQFAFGSRDEQQWEWKGKIGEKDQEYHCTNFGLTDVTVPLGKFKAFQVSQLSTAETSFWLAKDVGVVKLDGKSWDEHDPQPAPFYFKWELKEFTRPQ